MWELCDSARKPVKGGKHNLLVETQAWYYADLGSSSDLDSVLQFDLG